MRPDTTSPEFFEAMYVANADPWSFASSPYETSRYSSIFAAINDRRYGRAFEPGCSVGYLTEKLACIADEVEAMDISPTAAERTRARCAGLAHVHTTCGALPALIPQGGFDLIVFSEIGYYFDALSLHGLATTLAHRLPVGGVFLAAHWLGASSDHLLSGDRVHEIVESVPSLAVESAERHESKTHSGYRLERFARR